MTDYTQNQLVTDCLADLGVIGPGQGAPAEAYTFVARRLQAELAMMEEKGEVDWDVTGDIPDTRYQAVLEYIATVVGPAYGSQVDPGARRSARAKLISLSSDPYVSDESVSDY